MQLTTFAFRTPDERDAILTQYKKIMQLIPSINEDAQFYRENPDALCDVIRYVSNLSLV